MSVAELPAKSSVPIAPDRFIVASATAAIASATLSVGLLVDWRQSILLVLGVALGIALFHANFGFTGGWRALVTQGRSAGLRAQMLAIGLATLFVLPLTSIGSAFDLPLTGAEGPIGVSLIVGSLMFGIGMQLGGGCGSGTLFTVGGGNSRMLVTLLFFIVGAVFGTRDLPWWADLPSIGVIRLDQVVGVGPAILLTVTALALVATAGAAVEQRWRGSIEPLTRADDHQPNSERLLQGRWPLAWGAVALAGLSVLVLLVSGHPWSITFAFNLWGAKIISALGVDVAGWTFWTWPMPAQALASPVLAETTTVTDLGIILGALLASGLAGTFQPEARTPYGSLIAAVVGGLLMGYGARLAFGCNVGALFSGIASGSLHGWVWFATAFIGSVIGIRLRPLFGLAQ